MRRTRPLHPILLAALLSVGLGATGCSTRDDPAFNPYEPHGEHITLGATADWLDTHSDEALDNLELRTENALR